MNNLTSNAKKKNYFVRTTALSVASALLFSGLTATSAAADVPICDSVTTYAVIDSENVTIETIGPTETACRIEIPAGRFAASIAGGGGGGGGGASTSAGRGGGGGGGGGKSMGPGGTLGVTQYLTVNVGSGGAGGSAGVELGAAATDGSSGEQSSLAIGPVEYAAPGGSGGLAGGATGGDGGNSGNGKTGSSASGLQGGQGASNTTNGTGAKVDINPGDTQVYTGTSITRGSGGGGANADEFGLSGSESGDGGQGGRGSQNRAGLHYGYAGGTGSDGEVIIIYWGTLPTPTSSTVTFDSNGGTAVDSCISEGTACAEPGEPTKSGEHFVGWYTDDESFEDKVSFPYEPEADVTLYAFWISYTYSTETLCPGQTLDISVSGIEIGEPGPAQGGHYVSFGPTVTFEPWFNDEYLDIYRDPDNNFMAEGFEDMDFSEIASGSGELKVVFYHNIGTAEIPVSGAEIFRSVIEFKSACSSAKGAKFKPNTPNETDFTVTTGPDSLKIDSNYSGTAKHKPSSYTVKVSPGGNTCVIDAASSSCIVIGLKAGVEYTVSISATNKFGTSGEVVLPTKYILTEAGLSDYASKKTISGFAGNSAKLTKAFKAVITKYISLNKSLSAVTCTGYTAGKPVLKTDKVLAKARANAVCAHVEKVKPSLITTVIGKTPGRAWGPANRKVVMRGYSARI